MKFKDFIKESVYPSIDDNNVLQTLDSLGIAYTRTKNDKNILNYSFDNRYSLKYDGSLFTLYRSEKRVHYMNARNKSEIETALNTWNDSYELAATEITDDDVDDIVAKMKADAAADDANNGGEDNTETDKDAELDKEADKESDKESDDNNFYSDINNDTDSKDKDKK